MTPEPSQSTQQVPTSQNTNITPTDPNPIPEKITTLRYVIDKLIKQDAKTHKNEVRRLSQVEQEEREQRRKQSENEDKMHAESGNLDDLPYVDPSVPPNCTIYMNHLNERLSMTQLKLLLRELCERFGEILDIVVHDSRRRRGQAWIVYDNVESARKAIQALHGLELDGKRIGVQFAKGKSDAIAKRDGTYEQQKRKREIERKLNAGLELAHISKKRRLEDGTAAPTTTTTGAPAQPEVAKPVLPHNVLLVQALTEDTTKEDLVELFSSFPGFQQVRFIAAKRVAFVDFDNEQNAAAGLTIDGRVLHGQAIQVSYSKK